MGTSRTISESEGWSKQSSSGLSETYDEGGELLGSTESSQDGSGSSGSITESDTISSSITKGTSEAFQPILREVKGAAYTVQEHLYRAMATLVNQPTRAAFVRIPGLHSILINTPPIPDTPPDEKTDARVDAMKLELLKNTPFANEIPFIENEILERRDALKVMVDLEVNRKKDKTPAMQ